MKYGERSAEAVRMCVNARAALQSRVLTGLLPEQLSQLEHGWTRAVIDTTGKRMCGHRALRVYPRDFLLSGVQADLGHAGQARQGLREQEQSGAPVTNGAEVRVPSVFGGDGAQNEHDAVRGGALPLLELQPQAGEPSQQVPYLQGALLQTRQKR